MEHKNKEDQSIVQSDNILDIDSINNNNNNTNVKSPPLLSDTSIEDDNDSHEEDDHEGNIDDDDVKGEKKKKKKEKKENKKKKKEEKKHQKELKRQNEQLEQQQQQQQLQNEPEKGETEQQQQPQNVTPKLIDDLMGIDHSPSSEIIPGTTTTTTTTTTTNTNDQFLLAPPPTKIIKKKKDKDKEKKKQKKMTSPTLSKRNLYQNIIPINSMGGNDGGLPAPIHSLNNDIIYPYDYSSSGAQQQQNNNGRMSKSTSNVSLQKNVVIDIDRQRKPQKIQVWRKVLSDDSKLFSNERTWMSWVGLTFSLGAIGTSIITFFGTESVTLFTGVSLWIIAVGFLLYSYIIFRKRRHAILTKTRGPFYDPIGPIALVFTVMTSVSIFLIFFIWKRPSARVTGS